MSQILEDNKHLQIVILRIEQDAIRSVYPDSALQNFDSYSAQVAAIFEAIAQDKALANKEETL